MRRAGSNAPAGSQERTGLTLTPRALNRALLARQLLLQRSTLGVEAAIEHLVGVQAQSANPPYFGLWARLVDFTPDALSTLLTRRRAVRLSLMRSTIHLVTARDCLVLRPMLQPVQERYLYSGSPYGRRLDGLDLADVMATARNLVEDTPRTTAELGALLQARWPGRDATALAYACRNLLPLVQIPPRGVWETGGPPNVTTAESWLSKALDHSGRIDDLILRYLSAFGPANAADFQVWSGLTGMRARFESLRVKLTVFHDERGKELFDLPHAPRPDEETVVSPRFLGEYDNILLSHVDRTRIIPVVHRKQIASRNGQVPGTILIDGFVGGMWRMVKSRPRATLRITPFVRLSKAHRAELISEGEALLECAAPDARTRNIVFGANE